MSYDKRHYRADLSAAKSSLDAAVAALHALKLSICEDDFLDLSRAERDAVILKFDELNDLIWTREQDIRAIEQRWSMRHWTWQDHQHHALVCANID